MKPTQLLAGLSVPHFSWAPAFQFFADEDVRPAEPSRWRTYQWAYRDTSSGMSPLTELRIRACLERSLFARGFQRCDPPELTIAFYLDESSARGEDEGGVTLFVEIADARTLATVWRGAARCSFARRGASGTELTEIEGA